MDTNVQHWQNTSKSRRRACEECRRLKLKCMKTFPCESCIKRGCAAICPSGSFQKGTRSLKTSALKLHETMAHMSARIQELEDALAELQTSVSADKHPLLQASDADTDSHRSPIPVAAVVDTIVPVESSDELSEALGTLAIRSLGEAQFHGETAATEFLLQIHSDSQILASAKQWDKHAGSRMQLTPDLVLLNVLFPFPPPIPKDPVFIDRFQSYIPLHGEALRLSDIYYTYFAWCSMPITQAELHETIISKVYGNDDLISLQEISLQQLSLLFMVFALSSLFDIDKPLYPAEAEEYHSLARAALCGEQIFNSTTLDCVRSMSLMIWYMRLCRRRSKGYLWAFSGLLSKLVQSIGLHREAGKGVSTTETLRRQTTFWEYISGDIWQAFIYGRPSSMVFSQIDCKKPKDLGGMSDQVAILFYRWKYSFTHLVGDVLAQITGATQTSYRHILELERKLREFPLPVELKLPQPGSPGKSQEAPITLYLQRYVIRLWQHTTLLAIHRRFLVQAIRTHPEDFSQSPFVKSVYAAYESACVTICDLRELYETQRRLLCRMQPFWSHTFSAAIVLGALVMRSPSCTVAASAMAYLDQACEIFADAATTSVQPPNALEMMKNIQRKAREAFSRSLRRYRDGVGAGNEYVPLGSSSTSYESRQSSSPSSPLTLESPPQQSMPGATSATLPIRTSTAQREVNHAAQWLQQQAYFPPDASNNVMGTDIGVGVDFTTAMQPYGAGAGVVEDDDHAERWLHQQANYAEQSSSGGADVSQLQYVG